MGLFSDLKTTVTNTAGGIINPDTVKNVAENAAASAFNEFLKTPEGKAMKKKIIWQYLQTWWPLVLLVFGCVLYSVYSLFKYFFNNKNK